MVRTRIDIDALSDDDLSEMVKARVGTYALNDVSALRFSDAVQRLYDCVLVELNVFNSAGLWRAAFVTPKGRFEAFDMQMWRALFKAGLKAVTL